MNRIIAYRCACTLSAEVWCRVLPVVQMSGVSNCGSILRVYSLLQLLGLSD